MTTSTKFSYRDLPPLERGGRAARAGFGFQDNVAVHFCLQLLESGDLQEVWCETHDDITLVWRDNDEEVFEFVQVKNQHRDQYWSLALLYQGESNPGDGSTKSIIEKSMDHDRGLQRCQFRLVTSAPFNKELRPATVPLTSPARSDRSLAPLIESAESKLGHAVSPNGNSVGHWLRNALLEDLGQQEGLEARNKVRLRRLMEAAGLRPTSEQDTLLYNQLLLKVQAAACANWDVDRTRQRLDRAGLHDWLLSQAGILQIVRAETASATAAHVLDCCRKRFSVLHARWDLQQIRLAIPSHMVDVDLPLEAMYVPLEFVDPAVAAHRHASTSMHLTSADLAGMPRSLVVRGPSGCGKTTWLRWMFHQLLRTADALPVLLPVRGIARQWEANDPRGIERSLDQFINDEISQHVPEAAGVSVPALLDEPHMPRLILLVDGWDEVGPFGCELRSKLLGFLALHTRAIAVVTSRPYGASRPSDSEGFSILDFSPLDVPMIKVLAHRFFSVSTGDKSGEADHRTQDFLTRLDQSPSSFALARTPLLLLMMLSIRGRERLPTKLHRLYEACLEPLVATLPTERSGNVAEDGNAWFPEAADERLDVASALAARTWEYSQLHSWTYDELEGWLPSGWPTDGPLEVPKKTLRFRFLRWLAGPGNLLDEQADGTLSFRHRAFRDYFAARGLNRERRLLAEALSQCLPNPDAWSIARILALIVADRDKGSVDSTLSALIAGESAAHQSLAGFLIADELGTVGTVAAWAGRFADLFRVRWPEEVGSCVIEWSRRPPDERRTVLCVAIRGAARRAPFSALVRFNDLSLALGETEAVSFEAGSVANEVVLWLRNRKTSNRQLGAARFLSLGVPLWPGSPTETALNLWPSRRRAVGARLQLAAACGATREDLVRCAAVWIPERCDDQLAETLASRLAASMLPSLHAGEASRDSPRHDPIVARWLQEFATEWARATLPELVRLCGPEVFDEETFFESSTSSTAPLAGAIAPFGLSQWLGYRTDWAVRFAMGLSTAELTTWDESRRVAEAFHLSRSWTLDWMNYWGIVRGRDFARHISWVTSVLLVQDWASGLKVDLKLRNEADWLEDFTWFDWNACGCYGLRALFAELRDASEPLRRIGVACRAHLKLPISEDDLDDLHRAAASPTDPWPALSRRIAGLQRPDDTALLVQISKEPGLCGPALENAMRYIVRGDVILDAGAEVTIDALAAEARLDTLPYLDEVDVP